MASTPTLVGGECSAATVLACDHALSLYLCNLFSLFFPSRAKEAKKQKK